jgi:hypothetical protein
MSAEAPRSCHWSSAAPMASRLSASAVSTSTLNVAGASFSDANCCALLGLRRFCSTPTRVMSGNASFNRPRRLVPSSGESDVNPVMLPSGRALPRARRPTLPVAAELAPADEARETEAVGDGRSRRDQPRVRADGASRSSEMLAPSVRRTGARTDIAAAPGVGRRRRRWRCIFQDLSVNF